LNLIRVWGVLSLTFKDSIRAKWLLLFSGIFFLLAINIPSLVASQAHILPRSYLSTFLSVLIPVAFPVIPLLSLPMGATTIVDERESGTLQFMLSNPISKSEFFFGRAVGLVLSTTLAVVVGFGGAAVVSYTTNFSQYSGIVLLIEYACALNMAMLGLGLIVSNLSKRKVTALVTAIFIWLLLTVLSSVDAFAIILNLKFGELAAVGLVLLDPIELSRIITVLLLGLDPDYWGNLGLIAYDFFGREMLNALSLALVSWIVILFVIGFSIFNRQDVG